MLSIPKNLYNADEYTLLDGDKSATVQPSFGVKQGLPPLPPAVFHLLERHWQHDWWFTVKTMLFADDLSLHFNQTRGLADHAKQTSWEYTLRSSL